MHNIKTNFDKFYQLIQEKMQGKLTEQGNFKRRGCVPTFSDLSVMSLSLVSEAMGIDSENFLFGKLHAEYSQDFPTLIDRSQYNKRRKKLMSHLEQLRVLLRNELIIGEDTFIVDSMPMEVCKISRSSRAKICRESFETSPDKGYCASQSMYFYGYKLHGIISVEGVFQSIDITKASIHDIHYLNDVKQQLSNCLLLGDKGYLSRETQIDLFTSAGIKLETPMRINQKQYSPQPYIFRKTRKRIETVFSQLCDQFMIRRNYAKSFLGFSTRVLTKVTALSILQYLNKFLSHKPINNLKYALF
ncbi:MAG: IS982 family transposase [Chitinophagaceae bacterium]